MDRVRFVVGLWALARLREELGKLESVRARVLGFACLVGFQEIGGDARARRRFDRRR